MIRRYHDGTKHHFHGFARSLGYLDWASQPDPFRSFRGAPALLLPPHPDAPPTSLPVGAVLRHALGLTAWKVFRTSRWSLRANPSSGNLHPTEAYVIAGPLAGLSDSPAVYHYAADRHALERRAMLDVAPPGGWILVALTSIHWRESWKYGERAFRYCQHDLGHAIAALDVAARLEGWRTFLLPAWSHDDIAATTGIDRDADYVEAEREEPGCILALLPADAANVTVDPAPLVAAARRAEWSGRASQLSVDHVQWSFIDQAAEATRDAGRPDRMAFGAAQAPCAAPSAGRYSHALVRQRRSAVALDGRSTIGADRFLSMLARTMPSVGAPFDALWWSARIHLALFVHRVEGLDPGLYLLARERSSGERLRDALGRTFTCEAVTESLPLWQLARGDCRRLAARLSCDQEIAADGCFSLGMIADFDASLEEFGPPFYRHLFWESGIVGQVLYLEAEAAGLRGTGIGCFYDDPVHDLLGLAGHAFQSLYHFTIGMPVEDTRLTTEPGYPWEPKPSVSPLV